MLSVCAFDLLLSGIELDTMRLRLGCGFNRSSMSSGSHSIRLLNFPYSAQIVFLEAEFTRHYALWFGSLQHERLRVEEMERPAAATGS